MPRKENGQANTLAQQASGYASVKKYFHIQKPMRAKAELQVLDELVRPVDAIGLTAQIGLTTQTTGDTSSGMKDDVITKSRRSDLESSYNFLSKDFDHGAETNIRRMELRYVLIDSELYL